MARELFPSLKSIRQRRTDDSAKEKSWNTPWDTDIPFEGRARKVLQILVELGCKKEGVKRLKSLKSDAGEEKRG